ncbi:MAG: GAF domain-containing sensor histidine kinase [Candidatus Nanopelagicales bacterium]|nr:GAF domain-containing sensor histidine kinase [Candidatus Nanopelagicales bacterium]MDZ4248634.1 GAF domain-containing sensor histidine kinase [Candidatus Nanopelagicales bacterium]
MQTEPDPAQAPGFLWAVSERANRGGVPVRDPRFWVTQALVLAIVTGHLFFERVQVLVGESELYLLSVSVILIPVVYAALSFGLRGALPTTLWALALSMPEIILHQWTTRVGILAEFGIVLAIAVIVAQRVDREKAATREAEQANRRLARLNASAAAVADSLDLDRVLSGTLRAKLDPGKRQVAWIRVLPGLHGPCLTVIDARKVTPPAELTTSQEFLTTAACSAGSFQRDDPGGIAPHTIVAALKSEGQTVGAIGVTQPDEALSEDECQVHMTIANQLGVALNNIRNHASTREALAALSRAKENLEIYIALATEAQEEERRRLSRELHDDILQSLVVAKSNIASVTTDDLPQVEHARLVDVQGILSGAVDNLRRYCRGLRPSLLDDLGLVDAVDWLVGDLMTRANLTVDLTIQGTPQRLGSRDELLIFRVIQEALHNVERHAQATHAHVELSFSDGTLVVVVEDDGRGMATNGQSGGQPSDTGLGLRGMEERAKLLDASLRVESHLGQGTTLTLDVPIPPAREPTDQK